MLDSNLSLDPHIYNISRGTVFLMLGSTQLWALQYYWGLLLLPLTAYLMYFIGFCLTASSYPFRTSSKWKKIYELERINLHGQYIYKKQIKKTNIVEFILTLYIVTFFLQIDVPTNDIYILDKYVGAGLPENIKYFINILYSVPIILIKDLMFKDGYYRVGLNSE